MAAEFRKEAAELERIASFLRQRADLLDKETKPQVTPEVQPAPEVDLKAEWERQVKRLLGLGFHEELGMTEAAYRNSIPEFLPQPEEYKGRFDIPLIVETRIPLKRQHQLAGIPEYIDTDNIENLTPVPDKPYTIWTHDANRYRRLSVERATVQFSEDEVGSPQFEVTALYLHKPFNNRGVDAAGSRFESGDAPYLNVFRGEPGVYSDWIDDPGGDWGALSRGSQINLGS